jgi:hypothetical protein
MLYTRCAGQAFRALLSDTIIYVSAAPDPRYDPAHWWRSEEGLVGETVELGSCWIRYDIVPF